MFKRIFINLQQTLKIFMYMALSILYFKLACANTFPFHTLSGTSLGMDGERLIKFTVVFNSSP